MKRGTFFSGRQEYAEIQVVEIATGKAVWKAEYYHTEGIPDYGSRTQKLVIYWAANSSSLTVVVGEDREIRVAMP